MSAPADQSLLCPVLIGRTAYLDALDTTLAQIAPHHGATLLVRGDPGVGKSRLLRELQRVVAARGFTYLQGACFEPDRSLPYGPILDLLRALAASAPGADLSAVAGASADEMVTLLPELGPRLPGAAAVRALEPEREKRRFFEALARVFTELAARRPLALGIEDLHWCDETSLEFLSLLARRGSTQPILLILTYRDDEVNPALRHFLAQLDRTRLAMEWPLEPLTLEQVSAMLRAIFSLDRPPRPDFLAALFELTEGNPFFIEESLKSLAMAGDIYYADGRWDRKATSELDIPRSVQDAVQRRAERLTPEARVALAQAAVVGKRFQFALLRELTQCDEHDLLRILKELIAAQLVVEVSEEQFAFRHALTRKAVYADLLARERKSLHRAVAETIERLYHPALDAHLADLADHFYAAGAWEQALDYGQRSGQRALSLFAPRAAIEHFTHALEAAQYLSLPAPAHLLLARGQAYETLGELERARLDYESAAARARNDHDEQMEWRSLMALGLIWSGREYHQAGEWFQQASALAVSLGDPILQAHSFNRLANWYVNIGRTTEAIRMHQRALAIFEERRDQPGVAETLDLLGMAHLLHGDPISASDYLGRAVDLLRAQGNFPGLALALASRAVSLSPACGETSYWTLGTLETHAERLRDADEARALALKIESLSAQVYVDAMSSWALAGFGDFDAALMRGRQALDAATEMGHQQWQVATQCILGRLAVLTLDAAQATRLLESALGSARALGSIYWEGTVRAYLADAYLLAGAKARARATLAAGMPAQARPYNLAERRMLWVWSKVALAEGDADEALRIIERVSVSAPGASTAAGAQPIPWLLLTKGEALAARADLAGAAQALDEAEKSATQRSERPLLWQIQAALGRVHLRLKHAEQAARAVRAAREGIAALADDIAEPLERDRFLAAALRRLPGEKRLPERRAVAERFGGLTEREREVAALIAEGKTNREIATELVVSHRTVDTHVSAILSKLGVPSRARIAAWAVEVGLAPARV